MAIDLKKFELQPLVPVGTLEEIYQKKRATFLLEMDDPNYVLSELDPANKTLRAGAIEEKLAREYLNECLRQAMWPTADGQNLDRLGYNLGLERQEGEEDESYRERGPIEGGGFTTAGSFQAYDAMGRKGLETIVKQVRCYAPRPGSPDVIAVVYFYDQLNLEADSPEIIENTLIRVEENLNPDVVRPIGDEIIEIKLATINRPVIEVDVLTDKGVDPLIIAEMISERILSYGESIAWIYKRLSDKALINAAWVPNVVDVTRLVPSEVIPEHNEQVIEIIESNLKIKVNDRIVTRNAVSS